MFVLCFSSQDGNHKNQKPNKKRGLSNKSMVIWHRMILYAFVICDCQKDRGKKGLL